jgi:DNA-binding transcriptional MerR regulator
MIDKQQIKPDAIYTYSELEKILEISRRTLAFYVEKQEIKPIIFGNKYRFLGSEILRFIKIRMGEISEKNFA